MRHVEIRARLFETAVVISDAARRAIGVRIREVFRPRVESVDEQAAAVAPLHPDRCAVVSVVTEIGVKLDRSELRKRLEVLVVPANVVERSVVRSDIEGQYIDVPVVQQADACRALVYRFHHHITGQLQLNSPRPVHDVRRPNIRIDPRGVPA